MQRNEQQWADLCCRVRCLVPRELGENAWYLIITAALGVCPMPSATAAFYTYLTKHVSEFSSENSKEHLSKRLRDVILKLLTIVGGPQVLSVLIPLAAAEGDIKSKAASSMLNKKWASDRINVQDIYDRGQTTINTIYGGRLLEKVFESFGSHKEDVKFQEIFTLYGLYLSDFEILTPIETEAVVYASISCLGLEVPGKWHLRGMGRLMGARGTYNDSEEMSKIVGQLIDLKQAVESVVGFVGDDFEARARPGEWATPAAVMKDLGGWGIDD
ncbi:hypothetical protein N7456_007266 [Penicillium angulare]|uniref:Uncharacterized protein n=1 Tax=Penicillium angulare TaxID=116970 RepID=A0A9W9FJ93_9EURO|nr:hypothetical protein N7456_007266 [Penicillium angulare]